MEEESYAMEVENEEVDPMLSLPITGPIVADMEVVNSKYRQAHDEARDHIDSLISMLTEAAGSLNDGENPSKVVDLVMASLESGPLTK